MKDRINTITSVFILLVIVLVVLSISVYRYNDYRKVGHTALYCLSAGD